ncbi:MAG TPA: hypothetical protein VGJ34_07900 [Gaiellaceae bacterium]
MRRRLSRPAVLAAAIVLVSLAAGIAYAVVTGRNSSGIVDNRRDLAAAGVYPGAQRVGSGSTAAFPENGLPVPRGIVTTAAFRPPSGTKQIDVVDFYVTRLRQRWTPKLERSLAGPEDERAFRVTFSKGDRCLALLTAGMLVSQEDERVYTLSAYPGADSGC